MSRTPDPDRLEDGLNQLRELGYLRTPASTYVARRVAGRHSITPAVLASSLWIGVGTGLVFALLLIVSAVISDTGLLRGLRSLLLLFFQLALVLSIIFALVTGLFSGAVLLVHRRGATIRGSATERALVLVPGLLATVYLVDRVGRALLEGADPGIWGAAVALLVLLAGFFSSALSGAMRGALAMVRLQLHGVWTPPRISTRERMMPAVVGSLVSVLLVLAGPYRPGDRYPWFDEIEITATAESRPLLVVGVDGLPGAVLLAGARRGVAQPEGDGSPTAYWNEISTGFRARDHGLASPSTPAPRGWAAGSEGLRDDPVLGTLITRLMPGVGLAREHAADRRELVRPPVWEIAARAERRARVINWWGSYPAVSAAGLEVVSDRQWLRHMAGGPMDSLLASPGYLLLDDDTFASALAQSTDDLAQFTALLDSLEAPDELRAVFALAATADLYHLELARQAAVPQGPDLVACLLTGPDILARAGSGLAGWPEAAAEQLRSAYGEFLLSNVMRALSGLDRDLWLLGLTRSPAGLVEGTWGLGPWPGRPSEAAAAILARLGVPAAADMAGVVAADAPPSYGRLRPAAGGQARVAPDLDQLRSLGYIGD